MKHRREPQSSALSFIDCICCGFGSVLLLFILTAKGQIIQTKVEAQQSKEALEQLQSEILIAEGTQQSIEKEIAALDPQPDADSIDLASLNAEFTNLSESVKQKKAALAFIDEEVEQTEAVAAKDRPSADKNYLSGLSLKGPRVLILLESSGSMLAEDAKSALKITQSATGDKAEKWLRAKAAVRAVIAAIPRGTEIAVFQMNQKATPLSGTTSNPYIDPYDNNSLITLLDRLEKLKAFGGANLMNALTVIKNLSERPSSMLLIGDGLPTAPNPTNKVLTESDRILLFNRAMGARPNFPFNTILFPFEGDPAAAGLFWKLGSRTNGLSLVPDEDWPPL